MSSLIKNNSFILITVLSAFNAVIGRELHGICPPRDIDFPFDETLYPEEIYKPLMKYDQFSEDIPLTDMKRDPNEPVKAEVLASLGVSFRYNLNPLDFNYPAKQIPWKSVLDPKVAQIASASTFLFSDIITVDKFYPSFWKEHFHDGSSIRYILNGTGFFDIRDLNDEWVRFKVSTGDFMQFPAGLSHRFSVDEKKYIHVMRFNEVASPIWVSNSRSENNSTNNVHRKQYVDEYLCGHDPDLTAVIAEERHVAKSSKTKIGKVNKNKTVALKVAKAEKKSKST